MADHESPDVAGYVHPSEAEYVRLMLRLADVTNQIEDFRAEVADYYVDGNRKDMVAACQSIVHDAGVLLDTAKALAETAGGMRILDGLYSISPQARQRQNVAKRNKRAAEKAALEAARAARVA